MLGHAVLIASVLLQIATAIWALRLIPVTKSRKAWVFLSIAFSLAAVRRIIILIHISPSGPHHPIDVGSELVAFSASLLFFAGVVSIGPLFHAIKRSEEALKQSEARYRGIVEDQMEMICRFRPDGILTFVNDSYCRYFEKCSDELIGKNFIPLIPDEDRKRYEEHLASLDPENPMCTIEHRVFMPDGSVRWNQWLNRAFFDNRGRAVEIQSSGRDITDRIVMEEMLQKEREKLETILSSMHDQVYIINSAYDIEYINPEAFAKYGPKIDRKCYQYFHHRSDACPWCKNPQVFKGETVRWTWTSQDKKTYDILDLPLRNSDGSISKLKFLHDITEHVELEEALRESEERFRSLVETINDCVFEVDDKAKFTYVSPRFEDLYGYDPKWAIGKAILDFVPDEERDQFSRVIQGILESRMPFTHVEFKFLHAAGYVVETENNGVGVFNELGEFMGYRGVSREVTSRKRMERDLRESEHRFRSVFDYALDAILIADDAGSYVDVNQSASILFGSSRTEMIGRSIGEYARPGCDFTLEWKAFLEGGTEKGEFRLYRPDGEVRETEYSAVRNFLPGFHLAVLRDITQRKQMETALRESAKQLRFLTSKLLTVQEEERGRLAREIHDSTGQTLAAIKFNLENAMEGAKALGIAGKTAAAWLEPLVPMVMKAIEEVRTIYMGLRPTVLDDFGIGAGIEWFCREFAKAYPQIEISRMIDVEEENLTPELNTIIYRTIQEALTNVAKHSWASIVNLFLVEDENIIELTVEDNGTGFDLLEVLRSDDPLRGFGLASMRELVEISGGQFAIESTVGKGTYIRATWPCRRLETI